VAQRIVDRISTGLDAPVSIADAAGQITASTTTNLVGAWSAPAARAVAAGELVENRDGVLTISVPLVYANQVVGALVFDDAPQHWKDLAQVARTLAELIIHQATVIEQLPRQAWARDKFIADLVHERLPESPELVFQEAALLAIDLTVPRIVVVIETRPANNLLERTAGLDTLPLISHTIRAGQLRDELLDQVRATLATHPADACGFLDDHRLIMLAAIDEQLADVRRRQIARDGQRLLDHLGSSLGLGASAGIGRYYPGWPALAQSFADAQFALETGAALQGAGHVFSVEELGLASFICSDNHALKSELAHRLLQPIAADPELVDTLAAFLEADLSPSPTAQSLHIHRHTLAYRLDKIALLTGLDPRHFEAAAQLRAALLLRQLDGACT
jgi:carbohydrate diacid regulator